MVKGSHFVTVFDGVTYPAQGETIDAILAFAATKSANGYGERAVGWLEGSSVRSNYIGAGTESYAGATAKLALAAEVRGVNPAKFGPVNLIARLAKLLAQSGRYSDHSAYGDFSNDVQPVAGDHRAQPARRRARQGGHVPDLQRVQERRLPARLRPEDVRQRHRLDRLGGPGAAGGRPAGPPPTAGCGGSRMSSRATADWMQPGGIRPNANTTGLAGQAFAAAGWFRPAARAKKFLTSLQVGCSAPSAQRGALTYDSTGFAASTAVDATAQGILGLTDVSLAKLSAKGSASGAPRLACSS